MHKQVKCAVPRCSESRRWERRVGAVERKDAMKLVRVYSDAQGETHFGELDLELAPTAFAPPAPPLSVSAWWPASRYGFMGAPPGWDGDWHSAPQRLVTVYVTGEVEVTVSDGEVRRFTP